MNPIEIIAESPVSAAIAAATVVVAITREIAVASGRPRAVQVAGMLWGPYFTLLILFAVVVIARLANIFSE